MRERQLVVRADKRGCAASSESGRDLKTPTESSLAKLGNRSTLQMLRSVERAPGLMSVEGAPVKRAPGLMSVECAPALECAPGLKWSVHLVSVWSVHLSSSVHVS